MIGLREFNALDDAAAAAVLRPCLDVDRWVAELVQGRPYASAEDLFATARTAADPFTAAELEAALAHQLVEGNRAYEQRFGRVFLIRAAGRSSTEILDKLQTRLGNSPDAEDEVVADQLRQIALIRLAGVVST